MKMYQKVMIFALLCSFNQQVFSGFGEWFQNFRRRHSTHVIISREDNFMERDFDPGNDGAQSFEFCRMNQHNIIVVDVTTDDGKRHVRLSSCASGSKDWQVQNVKEYVQRFDNKNFNENRDTGILTLIVTLFRAFSDRDFPIPDDGCAQMLLKEAGVTPVVYKYGMVSGHVNHNINNFKYVVDGKKTICEIAAPDSDNVIISDIDQLHRIQRSH